MKKIVLFLFLISVIVISQNNNTYIIPNDAIRFRIIADSNSLEDQTNKSIIKNEIQEELRKILSKSYSKTLTKELIVNNMNQIKTLVSAKTDDFDIKYGYNYFPKKEYRNVVYPAGEYESLVITLGSGLGDNWWCVLYPPLCFVDENEDINNYDFYVKEIFNKIKS
jgi:stage II sporulation protein R